VTFKELKDEVLDPLFTLIVGLAILAGLLS